MANGVFLRVNRVGMQRMKSNGKWFNATPRTTQSYSTEATPRRGSNQGQGDLIKDKRIASKHAIIQQTYQQGKREQWTRLVPSAQGGLSPWRITSSSMPRLLANSTTNNTTKLAHLHPKRIQGQIMDHLITFFLPKNYPHSVHPEYLSYTLWQFFNAVTGTVTGTLAMQALLQALGLSPAVSVGLSATVNWIIKDGMGLLGGVLFAGVMGNRFDASPKRYRFLSNILIQAANVLELLTPLFPHFFLLMASASNVAKNVGWLAASATRAAMHKGLARQDNLGDITVKSGAQTTAAGLIGTALGIGVSLTFGTDISSLLLVFAPLSVANMWSSYRLNTSITTRTLSIARAEYLMDWYLKRGEVPPPEVISAQESFILPERSPFGIPLLMEPFIETSYFLKATDYSSSTITDGSTIYQSILDQLKNHKYVILIDGHASRSGVITEDSITVSLWFRSDAEAQDMIRGFYHVCRARRALEGMGETHDSMDSATLISSTLPSQHDTENVFESMSKLGWDMSYTHLGDGNRRLSRVDDDIDTSP